MQVKDVTAIVDGLKHEAVKLNDGQVVYPFESYRKAEVLIGAEQELLSACDAMIDLRHPVRSEKIRWFQPPWRTVYVYQCKECGGEVRVLANSFRGSRPEPSVGSIRCRRKSK
jgi:hypothetical protein